MSKNQGGRITLNEIFKTRSVSCDTQEIRRIFDPKFNGISCLLKLLAHLNPSDTDDTETDTNPYFGKYSPHTSDY